MAHEIRTPLNIVLMGLTMLENKVGQRYYTILIQYIYFYADSIIIVLILFMCNSYSHSCQVSPRDKLDGLNTHEVSQIYTTFVSPYFRLSFCVWL